MDQQKLLRAIVRIHSYGRPVDITRPFLVADRAKGVGTGAFIDPPESANPDYLYILTCSHVVDIADTVTIMLPLLGMTEYPAHVVGIAPTYDLAIIAVEDKNRTLRPETTSLTLASSANLQLGQKLCAAGYPLGQTALKASDGVFAGFQERLQHTVSISPGNSGGPLMNEDGEVVGVNNSGILSPEASNVGFAVPIELYFLAQAGLFTPPPSGSPASGDRVVHMPVFGIEFAPITRSHARAVGATACIDGADGGVHIITVLEGGPMHTAGIEKDDIMLQFDGMTIDTIGEVGVPWNYQRVRLQDVFTRSVEDRDFRVRVWKSSTKTCSELTARPRVFHPGALRVLYPPYDAVPYLTAVGLVIMPMLGNHAMYPATMATYLGKKLGDLVKPRVLVTHVFNGTISQIEGPIEAGDELSHVNNIAVETLEDVRAALPQVVTTSVGHNILSFRACSGKTLIINTLDARLTEERAAADKLYTPDPALLNALSVERTEPKTVDVAGEYKKVEFAEEEKEEKVVTKEKEETEENVEVEERPKTKRSAK